MNYLASSIIFFLNEFSRVSKEFDYLMVFIKNNNLLKGGILVTILWWLWFRNKTQNQLSRERIILTLVSCLIALFLARALAVTLPFRLRPLHNAILNFNPPYGMSTTLDSWSSFPSDHAVLFFALATGILLTSRKIGILVITYVLVVICFPRVYLGLHYPTDILGGALIGIGIAWLVISCKQISRHITQTALHWLSKEPGSFYACFFLLTYQIAVLFDPIREIGSFIFLACRALLA